MLTSLVVRMIGATVRRLALPTLLVLALGYWMFGSVALQLAEERLHDVGAWVGGAWNEWNDYGERRDFAAAQERFHEAMAERRKVSDQIDALRRQRDDLALELSRETSRVDRTARLIQFAADSPDAEFDSVAQVEIGLRRQRELRSRLGGAERMLVDLEAALARLDAGSVEVWNALRRQALDLNRRNAWKSAGTSYERARGLLDELPGSGRDDSGPLGELTRLRE